MDNRLECTVSTEIQSHLDLCEYCADIYMDFADLTQFCSATYQEQEITPPNSQALWCRISNIIESENQPATDAPAEEKQKKGFWAGVRQKSWQLSLSQVVSAVIGIAVVSSLLTIVGVKNAMRPANNVSSNAATQPSFFDNLLSRAGLAPAPQELREKSIGEKQAVIEYWNSRVEARKVQWNQKMRDTFDRNLREIDQIVVEYSQNLREHPEDALSEEMLDSALAEKMELLREFSEL